MSLFHDEMIDINFSIKQFRLMYKFHYENKNLEKMMIKETKISF